MNEESRAATPVASLIEWVSRRSPLISRRRHTEELQALGTAAQNLYTAVQETTKASLLAMEQWQRVAERSIRERDAAREEVDRLRATIATLVLDQPSQPPNSAA